MSTCTYHTPQAPACPAPATHRVVKGWLRADTHWRIEEVVQVTSRADLVEAGRVVAREAATVPEFCLRHAGDVMEQRNRPARSQATL